MAKKLSKLGESIKARFNLVIPKLKEVMTELKELEIEAGKIEDPEEAEALKEELGDKIEEISKELDGNE